MKQGRGSILNRRDAMLSVAAGTMLNSTARGDVPAFRPASPTEEIDLWPGVPSGAPSIMPVEQVIENGSVGRRSRVVKGIARPRMEVFRPVSPNGAAFLIMPGGGYSVIVIDQEGYDVARWLCERGWTVFVLRYRLPGEGWADRADVPLADAQRAMRLIRSRAERYGIDAGRIGALGFSAGGHVCGELATRHEAAVYRPVDALDRLSARPFIAAPIYAVQSMREPLAHRGSMEMLLGDQPSSALQRLHTPSRNVTAATPPMFMAHAEDDSVVSVENTVEMRTALVRAGVKAETHLFAVGEHGLALPGPIAKPARHWRELFATWAGVQGLG